MRLMTALSLCLLLTLPASAGTTYLVTATAEGGREIPYDVSFGGGRMFEQYTAFDPVTRQFVYLRFDRGADAPEPAAVIWDHTTGRTIELYDFPDAEHPLPIIPSLEAMAVCPITGDDDYQFQAIIAYD